MSDAAELVADELADAKTPCVTSSFQAECVVLVHMLRELAPDIPVLFLDTVTTSHRRSPIATSSRRAGG